MIFKIPKISVLDVLILIICYLVMFEFLGIIHDATNADMMFTTSILCCLILKFFNMFDIDYNLVHDLVDFMNYYKYNFYKVKINTSENSRVIDIDEFLLENFKYRILGYDIINNICFINIKIRGRYE